ncbi:hypothetical protein DPMN_039843 [Dreissena polymorpha]|uniref:Uncharacterized protein n=1 Tax=Dreissena polymorpha TaxID=45954 RepID=A0A9D4CWQ0_DREPO|nr:hypothetical protein DPMN_039843 [Dreissena polymorpha]
MGVVETLAFGKIARRHGTVTEAALDLSFVKPHVASDEPVNGVKRLPEITSCSL